MAQQAFNPTEIFVNENRKEAAKWTYKIIQFGDSGASSQSAVNRYSARNRTDEINQLAAEGWEPFMMSSEAILFRRDVTGVVVPDDKDKHAKERADLLGLIKNTR